MLYLFVFLVISCFRPKTGEEIVKKAKEMIGEIGYNLLWSNCEHFAKLCRYDVKQSDQVHCFFSFSNASYYNENVLTKVIQLFIDLSEVFLWTKVLHGSNNQKIIRLRYCTFISKYVTL